MAHENSRSSDGEYSDNDFDDDQDISMRFFATDKKRGFSHVETRPVPLQYLQYREVGCIIGKKGDNIKALRNESGAKIQISDGSISERIVTIRGSASQVVKAINLIGVKLEEDNHSSYLEDEDTLTFRLIVPNSNCGSLIGRNGVNIKELRERTGAKIQVANDLLPDSTEREVGLSGSVNGVMDCVRKLAKIAIERRGSSHVETRPESLSRVPEQYRTKPRNPHVPYNPSYTGGGVGTVGGGGGGGFDGYGGGGGRKSGGGGGGGGGRSGVGRFDGQRQNNSHDDDFKKAFKPQDNFLNRVKAGGGLTTEELVIPNDLVGIIIGKSGNKINEIRQNSGAQIKIIECEDGSDNRRFIITGPRGNVQSAIYLIQNAKNRRRALINKQPQDE